MAELEVDLRAIAHKLRKMEKIVKTIFVADVKKQNGCECRWNDCLIQKER